MQSLTASLKYFLLTVYLPCLTPRYPPLPLVSYRIYLTIVTMYKVVIRPEQKTTPNIKERGLIDMVNL